MNLLKPVTGARSTDDRREAMMKNQPLHPSELQQILRECKQRFAERYHVQKLGFFGSYARGEAGRESDVDVVFTTEKPDLFLTSAMRQDLEERLNRRVDVIRLRETMNPRLKARILKEAIYV
ncbi:MAG: nucleotidyltransferase family protein [Desulfococcaceae bacterium]